jgi:hypothetical protein
MPLQKPVIQSIRLKLLFYSWDRLDRSGVSGSITLANNRFPVSTVCHSERVGHADSFMSYKMENWQALIEADLRQSIYSALPLGIVYQS